MLQRARHFYSGAGRGSILFRALVGSMGLRLVGMGFGFLVGVQLARGLGPAGYGVYGLAMSAIALLMVPTEFGIPQLVTREVAAAQSSGDDSLLPRLLRWSARFVLVNALALGTIAAIVFGLGVFELSAELRISLWWGLALLPIVAASNILSAALRGLHRVVEGQIAELLIRPGVFSMMLVFPLLWMGNASLTPSLAMALNVVAAALGAIFVIERLWPYLKSPAPVSVTISNGKGWWASAMPLALSEGMRIFSGHLAILVLGAMAPADEVGMYRVAFGVYTVATLPSALLNVACSPMLAALHQEGRRDAIQRLNGWMMLILAAAALLCMAPFLISGEQILSIVFGQAYAASNSILLVLLVGEVVASLLGHPTIVLNMLRHDRVVTRFSLFSLVLNMCICVALVPKLGGVGAAVGVSLAQVVWRALSSWYAWRELGVHTSLLAWWLRPGASRSI